MLDALTECAILSCRSTFPSHILSHPLTSCDIITKHTGHLRMGQARANHRALLAVAGPDGMALYQPTEQDANTQIVKRCQCSTATHRDHLGLFAKKSHRCCQLLGCRWIDATLHISSAPSTAAIKVLLPESFPIEDQPWKLYKQNFKFAKISPQMCFRNVQFLPALLADCNEYCGPVKSCTVGDVLNTWLDNRSLGNAWTSNLPRFHSNCASQTSRFGLLFLQIVQWFLWPCKVLHIWGCTTYMAR